jgi:homopolymeric O-antigen transport system permease protein
MNAAADRRSLVARIAAVVRSRELLLALTHREVQVRYKQAVLGMAWAVFLPVSLMLVFTAVRRGSPPRGDGLPYPVWAYCGLLGWTLHQTSLKGCVATLVTNRNLLQKVYFPRELFPLAKIGAALVDFSVGLLVLAALLAWHGLPFHASMALLPVVVAVHLLLLVGVGLLLSAANVFFRDVQYVFDVLVLVWMFASPVFLDTAGKVVVGGLDVLTVLNPLAPILEGYRDVLLRGGFVDPQRFAVGAALSGVWFLVGLAFFSKAEPRFAERA